MPSAPTYCEAKRQKLIRLERVLVEVGVDERLQAVGAEVEESLSVRLLLLLRQTIFRLRDFELPAALQSHQADAKVGAT